MLEKDYTCREIELVGDIELEEKFVGQILKATRNSTNWAVNIGKSGQSKETNKS